MRKFYRITLPVLFTLTCYLGYAQRPMGIKITKPVICYAHTENNPCFIPPRQELIKLLNSSDRIKTSTIEVEYIGFGSVPQAEAAFQAAIDIWEGLISSPVPIRIIANWTTLQPGALGGALYTAAYANFDGAQKLNVFYPVALAEKITGKNLNGNNPDLFAQFSSSADWHFDPNSNPSPGQYDLVTVVLHEIGHGLGFAGTFNSNGSTGSVGLQSTEVPIIYDVPIENLSDQNLIRTFTSPSPTLHAQLTGQNLFFDSQTSTRPKLYAPASFNQGSSISHLDELTFNGTANALMTPEIAPQERIHDPGVAWNMLKDLGWEFVRIVHQPLADTENITGPYVVTVKIEDDNGFNASSLKLNYTLDGTAFTEVSMAPTGNPKEFSASIPSSGIARDYGYFISVNDNANRQFVNPGKFVRKLQPELQNIFIFSTGPDTQAPVITHTPKAFILDSETSFQIEARITDNIGIASVTVEYLINDVSQGSVPMVLQNPGEDSVYLATINLGGGLVIDDVVSYRISAVDQAQATPGGNKAFFPTETTFQRVNVVGLEPTQDSYTNNFNAPSNDFFGNGFSIVQPTGFSNPAIHSTHPYPEGNGQPNNQLNLIYQLKIPVRVKEKAELATILFDEIVLVEPGETGTVFGDEEFWDYVVVEGSKDGGITWTPVANGYDSRANSAWLSRYNSAISGNNSTAVGDPTLYRSRTLNLQDKFDTGDEVVIRFRLFSDPFAAGWGWAIDNLKIQIDETPPLVLHDHIDYVTEGTESILLTFTATDANDITAVQVEIGVNDDEPVVEELFLNPLGDEYELPITNVNILAAGDVIRYRIIAIDSEGSEGFFPPSGNFLKVPVVQFSEPVNTYSNTFNASTNDFIGNFFSVTQPTNFTNGAIHSEHFYPNGIGLNKTSNFQTILTKPITIASSNSLIRFDEVVIVEGHNTGVPFGNPNFRDYVIVEGSKDGGETWSRFLDGYDIVGGLAPWISTFNAQGNGNASMFRTRVIDMTANGNFQAGDDVLIRFRLFANETVNGWGWAIDNLYIQDPITSIEQLSTSVSIYPNPLTNQLLHIEIDEPTFTETHISLMNVQGQQLQAVKLPPSGEKLKHQLDLSGLPSGLYIVAIQGSSGGRILRKIIKTQ
ncbi:MAG: zinc-dependent metalloprotease [Cyclobacteriaceae bacterium]|nr:zinc-dependent metalloprotease [Cyclobacteriaceae bacterium]